MLSLKTSSHPRIPYATPVAKVSQVALASMKASEILSRYKAGERDFRRTNLRGQSFRGQDLSGADFSEADIRGANFTKANLQEANFSYTRAGLEPQRVAIAVIISLITAIFSEFVAALSIFTVPFLALHSNFNYSITNLVLTSLCIVALTFAARKGFVSTLLPLALIGSVALTGALALALALVGSSAKFEAIAGGIALVFLGAMTLSLVGATSMAGAMLIVGRKILLVILLLVVLVTITVVLYGARSNFGAVAGCSIGILNLILSVVSISIAWKAMVGDRQYAFIRKLAVNFAASRGTSFRRANLNGVNFAQGLLKGTDLRMATLTRINWFNAQGLDDILIDDSFLQDSQVQSLARTLQGDNQKFDHLNLEGIILEGANLKDASFVGSSLNQASLQGADLSRAILKQTQLDRTDLTGAILTGAYIEDWGITGTTNLNGVKCEYIFMRVPTKENPVPLRKPDNQQETFADGEFADFIKPYVDTLDLYHTQDVDPRAISIAFKNLSQNHPDADLEIVAMEKRGQNSLNLKVRNAPTANKSELSAEYFDDYGQLKALPEALLLLLVEKDDRIRSLEQMIQTALHQPTFNVQGDFMPEQNRNINVGRDLTISGSTLNLGEISGNVSNTIDQLQNTPTPAAAELADLLKQLQETIEADPDLPPDDKAEALEQVGTLAKAGQTPQDGTLKKLANTAVKILKGTVSALPDTAKLVESCAKLLPLITTLLGI